MSRKEKLAEEHAHNCFPYNASGNSETHKVHLRNQRGSFLAGYAACEQDAKVIEEALGGCIDLLERFDLPDWAEEKLKSATETLAKWKERGE